MESNTGKTVEQKRLSEDPTSSSASASIVAESDHQADVSTSNDTGKEEETKTPQSRWEDEHLAYLDSFPEIAGRYTDADPDFEEDDDDKILEPPIVADYSLQQHNKRPGNLDRADRRNYHQNQQGYQQNYRKNERRGGRQQHRNESRGGKRGVQGRATQRSRAQKRAYDGMNQENLRRNEKYPRMR